MLESNRRRFLQSLNSKYIYGRLPLLHAIIFLLEMVIVGRLVAKFNSYYDKRPLLTTMVTNAVLGGVADTVAQTITAYRTRTAMLPLVNQRSRISDGIELDDVNEKPARFSPDLHPHSSGPQPFDFERLTRFMSYGFIMTPLQFKWFGLLTRLFPLRPTSATIPALQRVAMDQLVFAPFGLCCFFTFMTVAEGGGKNQVVKKFQDIYIPTLRANYVLWPAVQILNFRVMPLRFQIPFVSTIGIAWTAYLSLTNTAEDEAM